MNALAIAKTAATFIASTGVGAIVGNTIKASTPADVNKFQKFTIAAGSIVLSGMIAGQASKFTGEQIEETVEQLKALKSVLPNKND